MNPTTKLVSDMSSYVHLASHRLAYVLTILLLVCKPATSTPPTPISLADTRYVLGLRSRHLSYSIKAMALVNDRLNANKPPPPQADPKTGKLAPGQINNNKDLDVEFKKEETSFFGSFFAKQPVKRKQGAPVMEAVSHIRAHFT